MAFPLQQWTAPTRNWAYRPQTVNFGTSLNTNPVAPVGPVTPVGPVKPVKPVKPIVDPSRDPRNHNGSSWVDGHLRPSVVDASINPLMNGVPPNGVPLAHVGPPPDPRGLNSLNPTITGVTPPSDPALLKNFGIGPNGVLVHRSDLGPAVPPTTSLNPALTGILAPKHHVAATTGIGPGGELVHKGPSPKGGTHPGKQSLSNEMLTAKTGISAKGKNVIKAPFKTQKQLDKQREKVKAARKADEKKSQNKTDIGVNLKPKDNVANPKAVTSTQKVKAKDNKPNNKPNNKPKDTVFKNNVTNPVKAANANVQPKPAVQPKQAKPNKSVVKAKAKAKDNKPKAKVQAKAKSQQKVQAKAAPKLETVFRNNVTKPKDDNKKSKGKGKK